MVAIEILVATTGHSVEYYMLGSRIASACVDACSTTIRTCLCL